MSGDYYARTYARATDPETSHEAAESVDNVRESQQFVHAVLGVCGPATDEDLVATYLSTGLPRQSESGIRTRRAELVRQGLVRWNGDHKVLASGRRARVWEVVRP